MVSRPEIRVRAAMAVALLAAAGFLAAPVEAQVFLAPSGAAGPVSPGQTLAVDLELANPTDRDFFFVASAQGPLAPQATFHPASGGVGPRNSTHVRLEVAVPADAARSTSTLTAHFTLVDRGSGQTFGQESVLAIRIVAPSSFLGLFPHLLPPPFASGWGLAAAETAFWLAVAAGIAVPLQALARVMTRSAPAEEARLLRRLHAPLAVLVVALGVRFALRLPPSHPILELADRLLGVVAVMAAALLAYRALTASIVHYSHRAARRKEGPDRILVPILEKVVAVAVLAFALTYGLRVVGVDLTVLLTGSVVVGLVLSLAAQDSLSNLFSGMAILLDRPFQEGDEIQLETGEICRVDRIGLRSTRLFHFRHEQEMVLPNNELAAKRVVNLTYPDPTHRLIVTVPLGYPADLRKARGILVDVARATPNVMVGPGREPVVWLRSFGDSAVEAELRVYIPTPRLRNPVRTALMLDISDALGKAGIRMPYPQREVWLREGEAPRMGRATQVALPAQDGTEP